MAGETTITIVGNLTADPELRTIQSTGTPVATFTIASTPRTFDKNQNQWVDAPALFMRCQAWRDLAAHIASSLTKGMRVVATGRLSQRTYDDQTGVKHTVVEMTVDEIGASLRYATCQVTKTSTSTGFAGSTPQTAQATQAQTSAWTQAAPSKDPWGDPEPDPEF